MWVIPPAFHVGNYVSFPAAKWLWAPPVCCPWCGHQSFYVSALSAQYCTHPKSRNLTFISSQHYELQHHSVVKMTVMNNRQLTLWPKQLSFKQLIVHCTLSFLFMCMGRWGRCTLRKKSRSFKSLKERATIYRVELVDCRSMSATFTYCSASCPGLPSDSMESQQWAWEVWIKGLDYDLRLINTNLKIVREIDETTLELLTLKIHWGSGEFPEDQKRECTVWTEQTPKGIRGQSASCQSHAASTAQTKRQLIKCMVCSCTKLSRRMRSSKFVKSYLESF